MKVKLIFTLVFTFLLGETLFSQNKIIELGDNAYENENYGSAARYYQKVIDNKGLTGSGLNHPYEAKTGVYPVKKSKSDTSNTEKLDAGKYVNNALTLHKLANSYRKNSDYKKAEKWYAIAIKYPVDNLKFDVQHSRFWYGEALMKNEKYKEARLQFDLFKKETADTTMSARADNNSIGCFYTTGQLLDNEGLNLSLSGKNINFGAASYGLNFFGDEMTYIFSADSSKGTVADKKKQNSDFYISQQIMDYGWGKATNFNPPVNSESSEYAGVLSVDRSTFYFTRKSGVNNKDVAIYISKHFNHQWIQPLKINNKVKLKAINRCTQL